MRGTIQKTEYCARGETSMKVGDIMKQPVVTVREDATLEEVAQTMLDHRVWGLPVVNDRGEMTGILTESDFVAKEVGVPFSRIRAPQLFGNWIGKEEIEKLYEAARTLKAIDVMSYPVVAVTEDEPVDNVVQLMVSRGFNRIPVVRGSVPVGIIARNDLLKMMAHKMTEPQGLSGAADYIPGTP
jgi:CBS domain-containing protein